MLDDAEQGLVQSPHCPARSDAVLRLATPAEHSNFTTELPSRVEDNGLSFLLVEKQTPLSYHILEMNASEVCTSLPLCVHPSTSLDSRRGVTPPRPPLLRLRQP